MTAQLLDGKEIAKTVRAQVKRDAEAFQAEHGRPPGLHVVLVGDDPASQVYVGSKERAAGKAGIAGSVHRLPADTSQVALLELIDTLNADQDCDGILVQLPLPPHLDADEVVLRVDPDKDVDGLHPVNTGRLAVGLPGLRPCTPSGCIRMLEEVDLPLSGKHALVIGRSNLVGKPIAHMLLEKNATVTIAHSRTEDVEKLCREADVVVAAVGRPEMVRGDWIKPGAAVIDVGINRLEPEAGQTKGRLVGDVAFEEANERAAFITPVPGGVGPMTIAMLLHNTVVAAQRRQALRE